MAHTDVRGRKRIKLLQELDVEINKIFKAMLQVCSNKVNQLIIFQYLKESMMEITHQKENISKEIKLLKKWKLQS